MAASVILAYVAGCAAANTKFARVTTALKPYQQRVVDRIQQDDQPGLVVAHGLGSGKTLTSIAAQDALAQDADVAVPAALRGNYMKEVAKHVAVPRQGAGLARHMQSMQGVAVNGTPLQQPLMILDEAHRARDAGSKTYKALAKTEAQKRLLLTASPFYNHPSDIAPLINMAAGQQVLPDQPADFTQRYIHDKTVSPGLWGRLRGIKPGTVPMLDERRRAELSQHFAKWVDYHKPVQTPADYPTVVREDIRVPMSAEQLKVYDTMMGKAPPWVAWKVNRGLPPSKAEAAGLNTFLNAARQVSNTTAPFVPAGQGHDPKIQAAFDNLKTQLERDPHAKAVVYSNYLDAGLNPYKAKLDAAHIPYGEFTGAMSKKERDGLVQQYNDDKLRTLLISSAGGEGLDLKGTRLMQILDPHWNDEKIRQVEGRGIRYRSHAALPEAERNVRVQRYLATRPTSGVLERLGLKKPGGSVDQYMTQRATEKDQLVQQFRDILQTQDAQAPVTV